MYFIVLFHIDSCDPRVLFGGDKKGKVTKRTNCNIWEKDNLFNGSLILENNWPLVHNKFISSKLRSFETKQPKYQSKSPLCFSFA